MLTKFMNKINDMRPPQLMGLAAVCGLLMFALFYGILSSMSDKEESGAETKEVVQVETVKVVVAKQNIPIRTRIQENMLQMKEMPMTAVPEGAIKDFSTLLNEPARVSIFAGDVLTQQKLFGEHSDEGFLGTIPQDCRAVSISVNNITGVAGFAKPGDFVDLLFVENDNYSATTEILLQNVQLLSINQSMSAATVDGEAINNPTIATLALRPAEALKVVSAAKLGEIYLMLRPFKPQNMYVGEMDYTMNSVNKPAPKPEPAPQPVQQPMPQIPVQPAPNVTPPPEPKIDIIVGDEMAQKSEDVQVITPQPSTNPRPTGGRGGSMTELPMIPSMPIVDLPPIPSGN